ncbi:hypothetical protein ACFQI7_25315 [Paenibacillus allorhizosphaerae]|uniref:Thioesterase domain-containing protein n=1 Tax=Paenibacillus allorhizosphaerae TaxID=2849866 RepID=A0ABM8VJ92_9BACL|nr:hypothetical protein [Paenibacillus allorhizosphaerae]CAG7645137.1 hypothetical protein PAECIP111802_03439 [Paenibacillus allorhizosphaerae]
MRKRTDLPENKINIYTLAGVATAPTFMEDFSSELTVRLRLGGWDVRHTELLFPYGDWSRKLLYQLLEMRNDLYPLRRARLAPIGGKLAADAVAGSYSGGLALLIGHSGGGVAAVQAAELLCRAGTVHSAQLRVVQIGSPKCPVPEPLRERTLYIRSARDPATLIGNWGGFERGSFGQPWWNARKYAPSHHVRLPIIGKHADYFRRRSPYVNREGFSNLELTLTSIWNWLHQRI